MSTVPSCIPLGVHWQPSQRLSRGMRLTPLSPSPSSWRRPSPVSGGYAAYRAQDCELLPTDAQSRGPTLPRGARLRPCYWTPAASGAGPRASAGEGRRGKPWPASICILPRRYRMRHPSEATARYDGGAAHPTAEIRPSSQAEGFQYLGGRAHPLVSVVC